MMSPRICPSLILPNINELFLPGEFSSFSCNMVGRLSSTEARTPSPSGGVRAKCTHTKCIDDTTLGSHFMQLCIRIYQDGNAGNYQVKRFLWNPQTWHNNGVCLYEKSQHITLTERIEQTIKISTCKI